MAKKLTIFIVLILLIIVSIVFFSKQEFMKKRNIEILATILLALALALSVGSDFVSEKKNRNFERQIEQDLDLSKTYGETNARWLELNEMLQRNLAAVLSGNWDKTLEEYGKIDRNKFKPDEWNYWKDKKVSEFWEHTYRNAWNNLRSSIKETNEKRHAQENFIIKNKIWNIIEYLFRFLQILFIISALCLYVRIIKKFSKK